MYLVIDLMEKLFSPCSKAGACYLCLSVREQEMFFVPQNYLAFAPIVAKDGPYPTDYPQRRTPQKG